MIGRQDLWNCLRDNVFDYLIVRKTVSAVRCGRWLTPLRGLLPTALLMNG